MELNESEQQNILPGLTHEILRDVGNIMSEALLLFDRRGRLVLANRKAASLFGKTKTYLNRRTAAELLPDASRYLYPAGNFQPAPATKIETVIETATGAARMALAVERIDDRGGRLMGAVCLLQDLRPEPDRQKRDFEDSLVKIITDLAAGRAVMDEALAGILRTMARLSGAKRANLFQQTDDKTQFKIIKQWPTKHGDRGASRRTTAFARKQYAWLSAILRRGEPVDLADTSVTPTAKPEREFFAREKIKSVLILPFNPQTEAAGFISLDNLPPAAGKRYGDQQLLVLGATIVGNLIERRRLEHTLGRERETTRKYLDTAAIILIMIDGSENVTLINKKGCLLLGREENEIVGKNWFDDFVPAGMRETLRGEFSRILAGHVLPEYQEEPIIGRNGNERLIAWRNSIFVDSENKVTAVLRSGEDITERKLAEEEIAFLAYHDTLTGLPNRRLLLDRMAQALAYARRNSQKVAFFFIDLDNFKYINDTLGHQVGDELLIGVAARLSKHLRRSDTVARLGGDEFNIVLTNPGEILKIIHVGEKIIHEIARPFPLSGFNVTTSASIGITVFPEDGENIDSLISKADRAMYRVKDRGGSDLEFFTEHLKAA